MRTFFKWGALYAIGWWSLVGVLDAVLPAYDTPTPKGLGWLGYIQIVLFVVVIGYAISRPGARASKKSAE